MRHYNNMAIETINTFFKNTILWKTSLQEIVHTDLYSCLNKCSIILSSAVMSVCSGHYYENSHYLTLEDLIIT